MKRLLEAYTSYFAVWVLVGGVLAYALPTPFLALKPFNKAFFSLQNAGMGTVLALAHFSEQAAISTAAFVYMCIITASIMAEVWRRRVPS